MDLLRGDAHIIRGVHPPVGNVRMTLAAVDLDDKYAAERGRVFLTGTQALVRLPMMQRQRDAAHGLDTACFVSGYRGSPLGSLDRELWRASAFLDTHHIRFQFTPTLMYTGLGLSAFGFLAALVFMAVTYRRNSEIEVIEVALPEWVEKTHQSSPHEDFL